MYNPVKLHFGKGVVEELGEAANELGKKAMIVYGSGSVKRNGSFDDVVQQLNKYNIDYIEFPGIKPNPWVSDVEEAIEIGRKEKVDFMIALGGGSVIDSSKVIALTIPHKCSAWNIVTGKSTADKTIPVIAVLTLAATGTEMNAIAVVQNNVSKEKVGFRNPNMFPVHSFLDPMYTLTVNREYTSYGITDLIAHCFEAYFGEGDAPLSDKFIYSIIKEAFEFSHSLLSDLGNYDLRARMMYAATNALNSMTLYGRKGGDWGVHSVGHILSVLYDVPHGASLSIAYPAWMRLQINKMPYRIGELGENLFGLTDPEETILKIEKFFKSINSPIRVPELNIPDVDYDLILETMNRNKVGGFFHSLSEDDNMRLVSLMKDEK